MGYKPISSLKSIPVSIKGRVVNNGENAWNCFWSKIIETFFDQKNNVASLSKEIRSKEKETTRDSKIRVKYNPRGKKLKDTRNTSQVQKKKKETGNTIMP